MMYHAPSPFSGTMYPSFLRVGLDMSGTRQFLKERTLFTGEVRWETYLDTSIEIAAAITAQTWHALSGQAEQATVLRLRRNGEREFPSIWRRHGNLATQHHGDQVYIHVGIEIITLALKHRVGFDADDQVEIAARPSTDTGLSFAGNANPGAVVHASIYLDLDAFVAGYHALAATVRTWPITDFARSFADRADLRRLNIEGAHTSRKCFLERHLDWLFDVIAGTATQVFSWASRAHSRRCSARTTEKSLEEVGETSAPGIKIEGGR